MRSQQLINTGYKFLIAAFSVFTLTNLVNSNAAYGQIDYEYGRNLKGIRLSAGVGFAYLQTHYSENPVIANFVGNLDYDINPYLSIGGEGQFGNLQGIDKKNHLPYSSSTNKYLTANVNVKVALGLFYKFVDENVWQSAVKRLYVGAGIGGFKNDIVLTQGTNPNVQPYGVPVTNDKSLVFPFSFGTNIDLLGLTKKDILVINPEFQFSVINSRYADGFVSSAFSKAKVGYYSMPSIKLKYKF